MGKTLDKISSEKTTDEREMIKVQLIGITVENDKVECILEYSEVIKKLLRFLDLKIIGEEI